MMAAKRSSISRRWNTQNLIRKPCPPCKTVIQGFQYRDMLKSGKVATVSELAQKVKQERAFLFRALSLVNLAPDIIEAILNGKEPSSLTLSKLRKGFPEDWTEQRKMFGMD